MEAPQFQRKVISSLENINSAFDKHILDFYWALVETKTMGQDDNQNKDGLGIILSSNHINRWQHFFYGNTPSLIGLSIQRIIPSKS